MSDATTPAALPGPGPEHQVFAKDVGTWDAEIEIRFAPGASPERQKGTARNRLACGGLWLVSDFVSETSGFEGHGVYGFDPARGKYVGTWVDSARSFLVVSEGSYDAASRIMTFTTEATIAPGRSMRWRETTETLDADTQVWRSFMPAPDGSEFEMMTVTYRRRR